MRDGITLATRFWLPLGQGPFPVILERGYRKGRQVLADAFTKAGYAYVGQECRGNLEGGMMRTDDIDGYDCLDWIVLQPWCNGDIAMYGESFMAATQWLVAPEQHPNLKAIVPQVVTNDAWERMYRDHGALQLSHTARRIYRTMVSPDNSDEIYEFGGWWQFYRHLPLITLDEAVVGKKNILWQEYVSHDTYGEYWKQISTLDRLERITMPVYIHAGWYDNYPGACFKAFQILRSLCASDEIRIHVDPTDHPGNIVGDRDFGPRADWPGPGLGGVQHLTNPPIWHGDHPCEPRLQLAIRWLDYVVRGIDNGINQEPPITLFLMGSNEWRREQEWPLSRTIFTKYYFHSDGFRHGPLNTDPPNNEPSNKYLYDPLDPVHTLGGNHSGPQDHPEVIRVGAVNQRPNWERQDILVFETPTLVEDVEVIGPVTVILFASSSAVDTDFIARLIDIHPNGVAYNLTEGILRARFKESIYQAPKLLEPGKVYEYEIDLQPTANVFQKNHRICVHITSSGFPLWDRNPNTGHDQGMDAALKVAEQTIFHDTQRPSHIILPVIPK